MAAAKDKEFKPEEQYILRVKDPALADRLRQALRREGDAANSKLELIFDANSAVEGKLRFEGREHVVTVLNLPCVVESYKTYDNVNLVKTTDVGQVLLVGDLTEAEAASGESADGVTPPMRNARQRLFRKPIEVSTAAVQRVERQLLDVLHGSAPAGYKFVDHEEVWQINEATGRGEWMPAKKT